MEKMNVYEVGKKICAPSMDAIQFDLADAGATLILKIRKPTAKEKKSFSERIPFRFAVVDGIVFILIQLGGIWMDAPYNRALSLNLTTLPDIPDGQGLAIHALLIDATTGVLVNQKLFSPDTEMSRNLIDAIRQQPAIPDYNRRLQSIYKRYTTNQLVNISRKG